MISNIFEVQHLSTSLKIGKKIITVVDDLTFSIKRGKTLALVGESGSGKSMTALSIMGILPTPPALPCKGQILFKEKNLLNLKDKEMRSLRGNRIAMIFQNPNTCLNPVYTVGEQLFEVIQTHLNLSVEQGVEKIISVLKKVGIPSPNERLYDYPHQLSGGMKQRIMIAMALLCEPDILIADEPTTALDVTTQAQVLELMKNLQSENGMAILLITHDMGVVAEMADDVIVMYAAQNIEQSPAKILFDQHLHPYTEGLFASRPLLHMPTDTLESIPGNVPLPTKLPQGCRFHPRCKRVMPCCTFSQSPRFTPKLKEQSVRCWLYDTKKLK